jgi:Zn-dependent metalloprotease
MRVPFGWLGVGAVAAGLGTAIVAGQGAANAAPAEPDSSSASEQPSNSTPAAVGRSAATPGKGLAGKNSGQSRSPRIAGQSPSAALTTTRPATLARPIALARPGTLAPTSATTTPSAKANPVVNTDAGIDPDPDALAALVARPGVIVTQNSGGDIRVIDGAFTDRTITNSQDAAAAFNDLAAALGIAAGYASADRIKVQQIGNTAPGDLSEVFYRLQSNVNGVSVPGGDMVLVTDAAGAVTGLFNYRDDRVETVNTNADAKIDDPSEALAVAAATYLRSAGAKLPRRALQSSVSSVGDPELVIYSSDPASAPRLAWKVVIDPPARAGATTDVNPGTTYIIYANGADAGTVARQTSNAHAASPTPSTASVVDKLGQNRTINVASSRFLFFDVTSLTDLVRNISTYSTRYLFFGFGPPALPGRQVYQGPFGWDPSAVSAQANIAVAYDYYAEVLGLTSFDGQGAPIKVSVNYNPRSSWSEILLGYANAFWEPEEQQFAFGNVGNFDAALDIAAHEYTHAVISYIVGDGGSVLDYGEQGALNEAFADIMGSFIEGKSGVGRWMFGEDTGTAVRNLANPSAVNTDFGRYATNYATRYTGDGDEGGEHINSTIFSYAAYKMMTDAATASVSSETWSRVFYHAMYRLSSSSTFVDGRAAVLDSASEFGFTAPQLNAIEHAFETVGIVALTPV